MQLSKIQENKIKELGKVEGSTKFLTTLVGEVVNLKKMNYISFLNEENKYIKVNEETARECMEFAGYKRVTRSGGILRGDDKVAWRVQNDRIIKNFSSGPSSFYISDILMEMYNFDKSQKSNGIVALIRKIEGRTLPTMEELDEYVFEICLNEIKKDKGRNAKKETIDKLKELKKLSLDFYNLNFTNKEVVKTEIKKERKPKQTEQVFKEVEETETIKEMLKIKEEYKHSTQLLDDILNNREELDNKEEKERIIKERYFIEDLTDTIYIDRERSIFGAGKSINRMPFIMSRCLITFLRNEDGEIIGLNRRDFKENKDPNKKQAKYNQPRDYKREVDDVWCLKKYHLYNFNKVVDKDNGEIKKLFIMEGVYKCQIVQEYFNRNKPGYYAIAVDGLHLTEPYLYLLNKYINKDVNIVLFLDNELKGLYTDIKMALVLYRYKYTNLKMINKRNYFKEKDENDLFKRLYNDNFKNYQDAQKDFDKILDEIMEDLEKENNIIFKEKQIYTLLNSGYSVDDIARLLALDLKDFHELRKEYYKDVVNVWNFKGKEYKTTYTSGKILELEISLIKAGKVGKIEELNKRPDENNASSNFDIYMANKEKENKLNNINNFFNVDLDPDYFENLARGLDARNFKPLEFDGFELVDDDDFPF